jgi:hypothetical protein
MRGNASENKSQGIVDFFESMGIKNCARGHEQWQNGLPEAAIKSIIIISRTIMVESGLGSRFWFKYSMAGCDARNVMVTYTEQIGTTPWMLMHNDWEREKCILILLTRLQCMGLSQQRKKRERKAYAASSWGYLPWIRT